MKEVPDLLYAMNSPCGAGHKGEFRNAALKTMHTLTKHNEAFFNLRPSEPEFSYIEDACAEFHGFAHTLSSISVLINPMTESMKRFVYAPQYQGDMDGEFLVRAVHRCLIGIREKQSPFEHKVDIAREVIRGFIHEWFEKEARDSGWFGRRERGHKASFYLAKRYNSTVFDLRRKFGFEDAPIDNQVVSMTGGEIWRGSIKNGNYFFRETKPKTRRDVIEKNRQTYRDIIDVKDEGFAIMIDRISGVIEHFQDLIWGAESEETVTKNLTGGDVLKAFLATNEIPPNPYFEAEFGL